MYGSKTFPVTFKTVRQFWEEIVAPPQRDRLATPLSIESPGILQSAYLTGVPLGEPLSRRQFIVVKRQEV